MGLGQGQGRLGSPFSCSCLTNEETEAQKEKGFVKGRGLTQARGQVDGLWVPVSYPLLWPLALSESTWLHRRSQSFSTLHFMTLLGFFPLENPEIL